MILVTGATGTIGRALVRHLAGAEVRAFVRSPADDLGVPCAVGDLDDPATIAAALKGVDRLFLNAGGAVPTDGEQPMVRQQKNAIDAAVGAGVRRIVKVSVDGAKEGGRLALGAHWEIERYLKASTVDWTILRPNGFMQNFLTGAGSFTADGDLIGHATDAPVSYVDARDIAEVAASALDTSTNETLVLTGPEALTQNDIAARLSTVAGRRIGSVPLPPYEMAAALRAQGLPDRFADDVATLWAEVGDGSLSHVTDTVPRILGKPARSFTDFVKDHAADLRAKLNLTCARHDMEEFPR